MKKITDRLALPAAGIFALLAAMALCMSFPEPELSQAARDSGILNMMENLRLSLDGTAVQSSIFTVVLFMLYRWNKKAGDRRYILLPIVCFALALVWLMAEGFVQDNTLQSLTSGTGQLLKCCIYLLGSAWLLTQLSIAFDIFISRGTDFKWTGGRITAFYRRHDFLCPFLLILLSCVLPLALGYPGGLNADSWNQLGMFFQVVRPDWGLYVFTSHHPPAHTVYISCFVALGRMLGRANLGLFALMIFQALLHSAVFAYALHTMRQLGAPRYLRLLFLLVILFSPYFVTSYTEANKDNVYSWAVLLFVIELVYILRLGGDYWRSKGHIALLALGIMATILFRNNGVYVIYPMVLLLLIVLYVKHRKGKKSGFSLKPVLCLLLPVLAANLIFSALMSYYHIEKGSIREALSLPFQQTARYVLERGDEVTEEEAESISAILDYENMAADYYPMESDAIKNNYNPEATTEDLMNYFKVWLRQGLKHPFVYIKATVNQNYPLVYPFREGNRLENGTLNQYHMVAAETIGITDVEVMPRLNNIRNEFNNDLMYLPLMGPLCNIATYVLVLLFLCCYAISGRHWSFFIPALPLLLSLAIVVAAPGISGTPRYAYPIIYSLPVVMSWYYSLTGKQKE